MYVGVEPECGGAGEERNPTPTLNARGRPRRPCAAERQEPELRVAGAPFHNDKLAARIRSSWVQSPFDPSRTPLKRSLRHSKLTLPECRPSIAWFRPATRSGRRYRLEV